MFIMRHIYNTFFVMSNWNPSRRLSCLVKWNMSF